MRRPVQRANSSTKLKEPEVDLKEPRPPNRVRIALNLSRHMNTPVFNLYGRNYTATKYKAKTSLSLAGFFEEARHLRHATDICFLQFINSLRRLRCHLPLLILLLVVAFGLLSFR